jgi:hypothetical protein
MQRTNPHSIGQVSKECKEALETPELEGLMKTIYQLLEKEPFKRMTVQQAIDSLGPEWTERARQEVRLKKDFELQQKALEDQKRREEQLRSEEEKRSLAAQEKEELLRRKVRGGREGGTWIGGRIGFMGDCSDERVVGLRVEGGGRSSLTTGLRFRVSGFGFWVSRHMLECEFRGLGGGGVACAWRIEVCRRWGGAGD